MARLQSFQRAGGNKERASTQALESTLAAERRINNYTTDIYARSSGGSGSGGITNLWNNLKGTYDIYTSQLEKDLQEIDEAYRLGFINGAVRDSSILTTFDEFQTNIHDILANPSNSILLDALKEERGGDESYDDMIAFLENAKDVVNRKVESGGGSTVEDWLTSSQNDLDKLKAEYGALEEPRRFRSDASIESIQAQNDLVERKQLIEYSANGYPLRYNYENTVIGQDGKINDAIAGNTKVVVDVWGANGYEQKSVADLDSSDYITDVDPTTGKQQFYAVDSTKEETESGLLKTDETFVWVKGANNTPMRVRFEDGTQGRQYFYSDQDVFDAPQQLSEDDTMAYLSGQSRAAWQSYPEKDAAQKLYQSMSLLPAEGSWVEDSAGTIYRMQEGSLRPVTNNGILGSYRDNGEFFDTARKMPSLFFSYKNIEENGFGEELRDWSIENQEEIDQDIEAPQQQGQLPSDQEMRFQNVEEQRNRLNPFMGSAQPPSGFFNGVQDLTQQGQTAIPKEDEEQPPKEEKTGLFNNLQRRIF